MIHIYNLGSIMYRIEIVFEFCRVQLVFTSMVEKTHLWLHD